MRLLVITLLAMLAACGQSGDLYLPEEPEPAPGNSTAAPADNAAPAETEPKKKDGP